MLSNPSRMVSGPFYVRCDLRPASAGLFLRDGLRVPTEEVSSPQPLRARQKRDHLGVRVGLDLVVLAANGSRLVVELADRNVLDLITLEDAQLSAPAPDHTNVPAAFDPSSSAVPTAGLPGKRMGG